MVQRELTGSGNRPGGVLRALTRTLFVDRTVFVEVWTERPVAKTSHGQVRGTPSGFRGIPFAAVPVGALAPQPPRTWEYVLDAGEFRTDSGPGVLVRDRASAT
nr:carboxylesterase family protein [Amycolatopsis sp. La24]